MNTMVLDREARLVLSVASFAGTLFACGCDAGGGHAGRGKPADAPRLDVCALLAADEVSSLVTHAPVETKLEGDACVYTTTGRPRVVVIVGDYSGAPGAKPTSMFQSDRAGRIQGAQPVRVDGLSEAYGGTTTALGGVQEVFAYRGTTMVSAALYNASTSTQALGALVKKALDAFDARGKAP